MGYTGDFNAPPSLDCRACHAARSRTTPCRRSRPAPSHDALADRPDAAGHSVHHRQRSGRAVQLLRDERRSCSLFLTEHFCVTSPASRITCRRSKPRSGVHYFIAAVYAFPIVGAILSDWLFGKYRTIVSDFAAVLHRPRHSWRWSISRHHRHGARKWMLAAGLACIAVGAGGIKPCVSAHVGDQFGTAEQAPDSRRCLVGFTSRSISDRVFDAAHADASDKECSRTFGNSLNG